MAEYLKIPEVARRLDVSEKTVRRYVRAGELPSVFLGGAYRISEEDLDKYLKKSRVGPGGETPKKAPSPPSPEAPDKEERRLHYLRALGLFVTSMESRWSEKVQCNIFSEKEFEEGIAALQNLEDAYLPNSGMLFAALRAYEGSLSNDFPETITVELREYALSLPETELEALLSTKTAIDRWHITLWHAYDALWARGAADVTQLADYRKRLQATESKALEESEQASGE